MTVKIFINGRFLTQSITGVQRYAVELVKALDRLLTEKAIDPLLYSFELLVPRNVKHELDLRHIPMRRVGHLTGHLWEQLELPFHSRRNLLVNLCNAAPMATRNQVVTIHDAAVFGFPSAYSLLFRTWYRFMLKRLGKVASQVITVSAFSRRELIHYCDIVENKLKVVHEGAEHIVNVGSQSCVLEKFNLTGRRYILAVSSLNPNKNFIAVVKAIEFMQDMDVDFVIAGGTNPAVFSTTSSLQTGVKYVGYVSDGELRALYEHAACFVYPSFYEGFGLPPLEAMACGCPVIVSQAASLPEVCGDAALYCDPESPSDIAEKVRIVLSNESFREELRKKGLMQVPQFSWERCARETFAVIEEVVTI